MEMERAAARSSAIRRSRYKPRYKKRKPYAQITRSIYGREVIVKLTYLQDVNGTSGRLVGARDLVAMLQASNDWANYAGSFQLFNVTKVKVQLIPAMVWVDANLNPTLKCMAVCYSSKDSTAPGELKQVTDTDNYTLLGMVNTDQSIKHFFKFNPRPSKQPPYSVTSTEQNLGYLKFYSDQIIGGDTNPYTGVLCRFLYIFTCVFSGEA